MTWFLIGWGLLILNVVYGVYGVKRYQMSWSVAFNWYAAGVITVSCLVNLAKLIQTY